MGRWSCRASTRRPGAWTCAWRRGAGPGQEQAPGAASLHPSGNRIEYRYSDLTGLTNLPGLVEWYANSEQGLEQGFTLPSPTGGGETIVLELAIDTELAARLTADGTAVEFVDASGAAVAALWQTCRPPTRPAALCRSPYRWQEGAWGEGRSLVLTVEAAGAAFPITLDPTITGLSDNA